MILSLAMCLRESLNQSSAADLIESLTYQLIDQKVVTPDLGGDYHTSEIFERMHQLLEEA